MKASDCKCVKCGAQAVAFWPVFDIDQDTKPKPYCRKCLDNKKKEHLIDIIRNGLI